MGGQRKEAEEGKKRVVRVRMEGGRRLAKDTAQPIKERGSGQE